MKDNDIRCLFSLADSLDFDWAESQARKEIPSKPGFRGPQRQAAIKAKAKQLRAQKRKGKKGDGDRTGESKTGALGKKQKIKSLKDNLQNLEKEHDALLDSYLEKSIWIKEEDRPKMDQLEDELFEDKMEIESHIEKIRKLEDGVKDTVKKEELTDSDRDAASMRWAKQPKNEKELMEIVRVERLLNGEGNEELKGAKKLTLRQMKSLIKKSKNNPPYTSSEKLKAYKEAKKMVSSEGYVYSGNYSAREDRDRIYNRLLEDARATKTMSKRNKAIEMLEAGKIPKIGGYLFSRHEN